MELLKNLYKDSPTKTKTRDRIIESAINLFAQKGMEAVLMKEIAIGCEITTRNLYRYYQNKELLIIDAAYVLFGNLSNRLVAEINQGSVPEQLKEQLTKYFEVEKSENGGIRVTRFIMYFDLFIDKLDKENPAYIRYVNEYRDIINGEGYQILSDLLIRGVNDGSLNIDLEEVEFYVVYLTQSLVSIIMRTMVKESENPTINDSLVYKQIEVMVDYITN